MKRFIISLLLIGICTYDTFGQQDSVIIKGKMMNLSGKLYREAPGITFSRNNILAPATELSVNAPLQPDGSFRASLPLAAPSEEIYLDYGGKVFTTFLAKAGEVEITFDADSMFKTAKLFYFKGVNADANNFYPDYLAQEAKLYEANRSLGADFQRTFWSQGLQSARQTLLQRGNLRQRALTALLSEGKQSTELTQWVNSLVEDESATLLMEYSLSNSVQLSANDQVDLKRFAIAPLSYQKVLRADRFKGYANRAIEMADRTGRRNSGSLAVDKIAALTLRYVSPLSFQERDKLRLIVEKKNVDKDELDFLSSMYKRGGDKISLVANFERTLAGMKELYDGPALEFLMASAFTDNFFRYSLDEKKTIYDYLKQDIFNSTIRLSLDELYRMEVRDSAVVRTVLNADLSASPTEVSPGIWMAESGQNGKSWVDKILKDYAGRPIYVINWDLYNDFSREELASVNFLRMEVPEDVIFLFLHVSDPDRAQLDEHDLNSEERKLWREYVARHRLRGTHLFLNTTQVMQLGLRTPGIPGTYYIIRPDGRYHSRNAPSPLKIAEAAAAITAGSQK